MILMQCACGGKIYLDVDESQKNKHSAVYVCEECGLMYVLSAIGKKQPGWKTKKRLEERKEREENPLFN